MAPVPVPVYRAHRVARRRSEDVEMRGWWCVRFGDSLAWVEAPTADAAVQRSLELHPLGDWTDDAGELLVCAQDAYPENAGPHDYTRAVLEAKPSPPRRRRDSRSAGSPLRSSRRRLPSGSGASHRGGIGVGEPNWPSIGPRAMLGLSGRPRTIGFAPATNSSAEIRSMSDQFGCRVQVLQSGVNRHHPKGVCCSPGLAVYGGVAGRRFEFGRQSNVLGG